MHVRASCDEVKVELQYMKDLRCIDEDTHQNLNDRYEGLSKKITSFVRYLE